MKKNWKILIFVSVFLLFLVSYGVISMLMNRIPSNDISVTGNTAGNINNGGLFAEGKGKVYFSNPYDMGRLYSMNPDETGFAKLSSSRASSINVGGNYLYFYLDSSEGGTGMGYVIRTSGLYRSRLNGKNIKCLERTAAINAQLSGDYLYYQRYNNKEFTRLYKIKTDKSSKTQVYEGIINPACCYNGIIYFNGTERDHYLYALDTRTDSISTVYEGNVWFPAYHDGFIYYMDVSSDYRLCRYNLSENSVEILTHDRVDTFNVGDSFIYYQRVSADQPALMRMGLDGSNPEVVAEGNFENLNLTSSYAYFNAFGEPTPVYHTPVNGPVSVSVFSAPAE